MDQLLCNGCGGSRLPDPMAWPAGTRSAIAAAPIDVVGPPRRFARSVVPVVEAFPSPATHLTTSI